MKIIFYKIFLTCFSLFCFGHNFSQTIQFQMTYGTSISDWGITMPVSSGGYVLLTDDVTNPALRDIALLKLDSFGNISWKKTYANATATDDSWNAVIPAYNGGYLISGTLNVNSGTPIDVWIRTDSNGDTIWVKRNLFGNNLIKTIDGGYAQVGFNMLKTDSVGNVQWAKTYPGGTPGIYSPGQQTSDKGYILFGETNQYASGGITDQDWYMIKTDSMGTVQWTKVFGGPTSIEYSSDVVQTVDGGYLALGYTNGFGAGSWDMILIKTDTVGVIQWTKTYGGVNGDWGVDLKATGAIGYIVTGYTGGFESLQNSFRSFLMRTDGSGNWIWSKMYGDVANNPNTSDEAAYVYYASDGGFLMSGSTQNFGIGGNECWLVKTDALGVSGCNEQNTLPTITNPVLTIGTGGNDSSVFYTSAPYTVVIGTWQPTQTILCTTDTSFGNSVAEAGFLESNIMIYPNPFTSTVTVNTAEKGEIQIYNTLGELVVSCSLLVGSNKIDLSKEASGIYFVRLQTANGVVGKKIIKE